VSVGGTDAFVESCVDGTGPNGVTFRLSTFSVNEVTRCGIVMVTGGFESRLYGSGSNPELRKKTQNRLYYRRSGLF
jgi:hypothetical protein